MTQYDKLYEISQKLRPFYDIDKVKSWGVFCFSKVEEGFGDDTFDILEDKLIFYNGYKYEDIPKEALPIIKDIQNQIKLVKEEGHK